MEKHTKNNRGFSVIEMAYVMVILGIILAVAVPSFNSYLRSSRLIGASNALMGDIHYARSLAISKRKTYHIEFTANEYKIKETATDEVVRQRKIPTGFSCAATGDPSFYAWGLADAVTITITGGGRTRNLALSANGNVSHL